MIKFHTPFLQPEDNKEPHVHYEHQKTIAKKMRIFIFVQLKLKLSKPLWILGNLGLRLCLKLHFHTSHYEGFFAELCVRR